MATDDYTQSKKTHKQRRKASRKSGATAKTSDALDNSLMAVSFMPYEDFDEDPGEAFAEILKAVRSGESVPYDRIEALYLALITANLIVVAKGRAVAKTQEDQLSLNLHLIAVRELQSCHKSFKAARGQKLPTQADPIETAMQKKLSRRHMQKTLDSIN